MKMFLPSSTAVGKYVISGKVAVLQLEPYDPADYTTKFTNTTVEGVAVAGLLASCLACMSVLCPRRSFKRPLTLE